MSVSSTAWRFCSSLGHSVIIVAPKDCWIPSRFIQCMVENLSSFTQQKIQKRWLGCVGETRARVEVLYGIQLGERQRLLPCVSTVWA